MNIKEKMQDLVDEINKHSYNYYVLDNPTISDKEWDALYNKLLQLEQESGIVLPDSPSKKVGGEVLPGFKKQVHKSALYSLNKCQSLSELENYYNKIKNEIGQVDYSLEYKFDGLTIAITYKNGEYFCATTRGNGLVGEDVTEQVRTIKCVPHKIKYKGEVVVQGEAIMTFKALEEYNKTAEEPLKNARNGVAGAIRNLNPKETAKRNLQIYFYAVPYIENYEFKTQAETMQFLKDNGLKVNSYYKLLNNFDEIKFEIEQVDKEKQNLPFLIDGMVLKINNTSIQKELGHTIKFPRFAMAYKFEALEVSTTLQDVAWQVGRTGKITPIAMLEATELAGATITRATLNNMGDIQRKKLRKGARVFIRRSNEVIPEVLGLAEDIADSSEIVAPNKCPSCESELQTIGANLFCVNNNACPSQIIQRIVHYCSRDAMNIEGISEQTAQQFYSQLNVRTVADLYKITKEQLLELAGFKDKKADNIISAIEKSKSVSLDKFIYSLGILNVGKKTARDLAKKFETLNNFLNAQAEQLIQIKDVGEIVCESIVQFNQSAQNIQLICAILNAGVTIQNSNQQSVKQSMFTNKVCVLTGTLEKLDRNKATEIIMSLGGQCTNSVSKNTDFVICGENAGSKLAKAKQLNVSVISEQDFYNILDNIGVNI